MRFAFICALLVSASLGISACNKHKDEAAENKAQPPETVQADVAKATTEAAETNAKAEETRKQTEAQASKDLAKEKAEAEARATDKSVGAVADAAVAEAEGATKVALAKCEALEGDAQQQCKDKANAHLQTVKDRAKAARTQ
jgi:hypothetical protein